ncbi:FadR/GntR family transcriptional regulator [Deinococcus aquiradiocola]|uniref:FadR/GntR family transcriptional regulator n=1 Tax=Deinococcus aquiradiocola TaxID=393059 RepID=UPI00166C563D|nr:FadR/GntR family transcriptional regulator [Deinococcus aquiradiocola]
MKEKTRQVSEIVADDIIAFIKQQGLKRGDRLPTEPELMERYGVSRTALREAIKVLASSGVIEVRHGHGTFVLETQSLIVTPPLDLGALFTRQTYMDVAEARTAIESEVAKLAAQRATEQDLQDLERLHAQMKSLPEDAAFTDHDVRLHLMLARIAGNAILLQMMEVLRQALSEYIYLTVSRLQTVADLLREHEAVINAVRRRDPEGAQLAMRHHVQNAARRLEQVLNVEIEA